VRKDVGEMTLLGVAVDEDDFDLARREVRRFGEMESIKRNLARLESPLAIDDS
jgi:hypothetical protein